MPFNFADYCTACAAMPRLAACGHCFSLLLSTPNAAWCRSALFILCEVRTMRIRVVQCCLLMFSRAFVFFVAQHWLILRNAAQRCATLPVIAQYGSVLFGAARHFLLYLSNARHGLVLLTNAPCCSLPLSVVQYCSKLLSIAQQFPALFNSYENR